VPWSLPPILVPPAAEHLGYQARAINVTAGRMG